VASGDKRARLFVLRHGKSDWPAGVADHDRPLAKRGIRDSAAAGRWLAAQADVPDVVWCSTARRTRQTWQHLADELPEGGSGCDVRFDDDVYAAAVEDLLDVLHRTPRGTARVLLVGHNPGVQDLTLLLAAGGSDDARALAETKFPTSGLAVLDLGSPWDQLGAGSSRLTDFVVPRG
jgi:phosphohistidine phosphatase